MSLPLTSSRDDESFVCVDRNAQHDTVQDRNGISVKGQPAKAPRTRSRSRPAPSSSSSTKPSAGRVRSPPGSLMGIIRKHSYMRLYVDPLHWTPRHSQLLKVLVTISETTPTRPHRLTCPKCNSCGKVSPHILNTLQSSSYSTDKDRSLTYLVRSTIDSFRTRSGAPLFETSFPDQLPFSLGGKRQCWVEQPLLIRSFSSETPLVAVTHESGHRSMLDARFLNCAETVKAKARSAARAIKVSDIHPYNVAVLIAMAQEAQHLQSKSKSQDQRAAPFTPTIITPTPDGDALYIYRASIPPDYLESFIDMHKPLEHEMRISRAVIPSDDTTILLETLGQLLDLHQRLETATKSIKEMEMEEENRTRRHAVDAEENRHTIKRQRYSKLPLPDNATPNQGSGG